MPPGFIIGSYYPDFKHLYLPNSAKSRLSLQVILSGFQHLSLSNSAKSRLPGVHTKLLHCVLSLLDCVSRANVMAEASFVRQSPSVKWIFSETDKRTPNSVERYSYPPYLPFCLVRVLLPPQRYCAVVTTSSGGQNAYLPKFCFRNFGFLNSNNLQLTFDPIGAKKLKTIFLQQFQASVVKLWSL